MEIGILELLLSIKVSDLVAFLWDPFILNAARSFILAQKYSEFVFVSICNQSIKQFYFQKYGRYSFFTSLVIFGFMGTEIKQKIHFEFDEGSKKIQLSSYVIISQNAISHKSQKLIKNLVKTKYFFKD